MTRLNGSSSNNRVFLILGTLVALLLIGITVWAVQRNQNDRPPRPAPRPSI